MGGEMTSTLSSASPLGQDFLTSRRFCFSRYCRQYSRLAPSESGLLGRDSGREVSEPEVLIGRAVDVGEGVPELPAEAGGISSFLIVKLMSEGGSQVRLSRCFCDPKCVSPIQGRIWRPLGGSSVDGLSGTIKCRTEFDTVKPVYNDHLMGYFSAFWGSSRWPRAT